MQVVILFIRMLQNFLYFCVTIKKIRYSIGEKMKVITLCGSMKFEKEMKKVAFTLETKYNMCVLQCVYNEDNLEITKDEITALNNAHFEKIKISDAIYVVNFQEYIGEQVKKEIEFAKSLGKEVIYHTQFIAR